MKLFKGHHYHEAIPEIKCLADFDGAQIFECYSRYDGICLILAYTHEQAQQLVDERDEDDDFDFADGHTEDKHEADFRPI